MKNVLVTGASGFVGGSLMQYFQSESGIQVTGTYFTNKKPELVNLDVNQEGAVNDLILRLKPNLVIHSGGLSRVKACEENLSLAEKINVDGTRNIVNACLRLTKPPVFIYPSSVYVYGGNCQKDGGWRETDGLNPVNNYGITKMKAERIIGDAQNLSSLIIRSDLLFGPGGGFVQKIIDDVKIRVESSKERHPLFIGDYYRVIKSLSKFGIKEIVNVGGEKTTLLQLGRKIESALGREKEKSRLEPILNGKFDDVRRPNISILDTSHITSKGFEFASINETMSELKQELGGNNVEKINQSVTIELRG